MVMLKISARSLVFGWTWRLGRRDEGTRLRKVRGELLLPALSRPRLNRHEADASLMPEHGRNWTSTTGKSTGGNRCIPDVRTS